MPSASEPADLHIASLVRLACEDLRAANALYHVRNRNTAYHLEQAVEKLILAILVSEEIDHERKDAHRLDTLHDKIPVDNSIRTDLEALLYLTIYATAARYPKSGGRLTDEIDYDTVPEASRRIKSVIERMVVHYGIDAAKNARSPARNTKPMRRADDGSGGGASGGPKIG